MAYSIPLSPVLSGRQPSLSLITTIVLLLFLRSGVCQDAPETHPTPGAVTASTLEAKIAEIEAATDLQDQTKAKLVELYRKALSNLQAANASRDAAEAFQRASQTAPAETEALGDELASSSVVAPGDALEADLATALRELESLLQKEKADLAAVDARGADFAKRLDEEATRPALIRQRLIEGKAGQEEVAAQLKLPPSAGDDPVTVEAGRWELETRYEALSAEIRMLDQELLSQPARVELMKAKRDKAAASFEWVGKRVKLLEDLVNQKRQAEADEAQRIAEAARREAEGRHPLVVRLAEQNTALTQDIVNTASKLGKLAEQTEAADKLARQLEEDLTVAQETVAIGVYGLSAELGYMLQQQRTSLPDIRAFQRQARVRDDEAGAAAARRLLHRREHKRVGDPAGYVAEILAEAAAEATPERRQRLLDLAAERNVLLEKAIETDEFYLRKLGELESAQQRLLDAIERFDAFLDEHLLWVRSDSRTQLQELGALPEQVWRILSPAGWLEVVAVLFHQATHSPVFVLLALVLGALLWRRKRLIASIFAISEKLGKPTTDRFAYSLQALALTLIASAAWPLVVAVTGWQLKASSQATSFSNAVGEALLAVAASFYLLTALFLVCMPKALAAAHFRWAESSLRPLRSELNQLGWIFLPAAAVTIVAVSLDPLNAGWAIGRTSFVIMLASLAFALYRLLHPNSGALAGYLRRPEHLTFRRLYWLWYPALVIAPLALGLLAVMGFLYTAGTLLELLLQSIRLVTGLVILAALAERWLRVTRRRLAYEAAMERRRALLESRQQQQDGQETDETSALEVEEEEVDLEALTDTSGHLFNTAVVVAGFIGLWMIWSEVFPAFRIFDDVALWHHTVTVEGEQQVRPITLGDVGLAVFYGIITVVLAKQLPAVLEMILLKSFDMAPASRYTVTTLTSYGVVIGGLLLVFNTIGAQWSQLQWLVAALGVGIGFGLQEIVANFISGLIILFERPVRVGDIVTVGDTDGVVTKIRIRATTIRNWDRKELLVPNKEFVTGRLLNWSLSDTITRVVIVVGVAYEADVEKALELMREAAQEHEHVLEDPPPMLSFEGFGESSLTLILRAFLGSLDVRIATVTDLHKAINRKFKEAGIVIAFPQRDLHLDTSHSLQVALEHETEDRRRVADAARAGD